LPKLTDDPAKAGFVVSGTAKTPDTASGRFFYARRNAMPNQDGGILHKLHINPTIGIGHILTTIGLMMMIVTGYQSFSERLAVLESSQQFIQERILVILENQKSTDIRQDAELLEIKRQMREDYRDINQKLDQLIRRVP
jgi:hypothetical protein